MWGLKAGKLREKIKQRIKETFTNSYNAQKPPQRKEDKTHLSQTRLNAVYNHICVFCVLLGYFSQCVDHYLIVEGEGDQGLPVLLGHLPGHPSELVVCHTSRWFSRGSDVVSREQEHAPVFPVQHLDPLWQDGAACQPSLSGPTG